LHLVLSSGYRADESDEEPGAGVQRNRASRSRQLLHLAEHEGRIILKVILAAESTRCELRFRSGWPEPAVSRSQLDLLGQR